MAKSLKKPDELSFAQDPPLVQQGTAVPLEEEASFLIEEKEDAIAITELKIAQEGLKGFKQDRKERKKYALKVFYLILSWLVADLLVVFLCGLKYLELSDPVIITLITTTTGSVITIFIYVMMYLFKGPPVSLRKNVTKRTTKKPLK